MDRREYDKPNKLATSGGQLKLAPLCSKASLPAVSTRGLAVNAMWPPPSAALKKQQDLELARINQECMAYEDSASPSWH